LLAGPLDGIRVIELAGIGPAPFGAMVLADLGADVIRVDRPASERTAGDVADPQHDILGRGKRSVELDLKDARQRDKLLLLIAESDVLIDPFRPQVLERLGVFPTCSELNPRLVVTRMTGWGQDGPMAPVAGHDLNYIAVAGALYPMGDPSEPPPVPLNLVGDFGGGGMLLVIGVLAALLERNTSGKGQVVDVAMVDGVALLLASIFQLAAANTWSDRRGSNWLDGAAPWYGTYQTADGEFVAVAALEDKFYRALLTKLGLDPGRWPQWDTSCWAEMRDEVASLFASATLDEWCTRFEGVDACFSPVLRREHAPAHKHLATRGTFVEIGGTVQPAPAPRFSRSTTQIRSAAPQRGEHTETILEALRGASSGVNDSKPSGARPGGGR
jgi:alpha-methylacyl-CoA racemase